MSELPTTDPNTNLLVAARRLRGIINERVSLADVDAFDAAIALAERHATVPDQRAYSVFKDGAAWCATASGFINLQESIAGFGDSPVVALGELVIAEQASEAERWQTIRKWKCNCCNATFQCRHAGDGKTPGTGPACIRCSAYGQYTFEVLP